MEIKNKVFHISINPEENAAFLGKVFFKFNFFKNLINKTYLNKFTKIQTNIAQFYDGPKQRGIG